ncbi:MAG: competence/damage-inducible protein A [Acetivibrionales bacterium]|jgi:nicotinamide-nucleotide amidase
MIAEILSVGTELLMGQISNTDAQYITKRLNDVGVNVYYHTVVGDNPQRLKQSVSLALSRSDVLITTGGLGPTKDDLTKETIAQALGLKLVLDECSHDKIRVFFERVGKKMMDNNLKQAYVPEGCTIIPNNNGTAPGCLIEKDGKTVIMLPGPPKEMIPMFEESLLPYFTKKTGQIIESKMLKVFGIGESEMETKILDIVEAQSNPTIAPYVNQGEIVIRVTARCKDRNSANQMINPVIDKIRDRLGIMLYALNGESMEEVVVGRLLADDIDISLAESCTGGMLASKLVNVPGVSKVFEHGFITYSNQAKMDVLGVSKKTLDSFGAVSRETAIEMVKGLLARTKTRAGISITGVAGPDPDDNRPKGNVFVAVSLDNELECIELKLNGNRERIRHMACLNALDLLRKMIINKYGDNNGE